MVGLTKSLSETIELIQNTFVVVGRNPSILKPTIAQFVIGILLWFLAIGSIASIFIFQNGILAVIALIIFSFHYS